MRRASGPLLVFGPRSATYDFGPSHPLTPRRFGPGIDLLRHVGAEPGLAPEPAPDEDLLLCHTARYLGAVRRLSARPHGPPEAGIGHGGDNPAFAGMHEAGATVAGGSLRAVEAILRGDAEHAHHPGGGLHHAMPDRASGFCIYDDPALAVARARREGQRVLYVDLDVHHGDGVEAIHSDDPGVVTLSIHESGRYLFPGTGLVDETGEGRSAGTVVNVPLEPFTGETAWLAAVTSIVPAVAAAFAPDLVVSQHGADSHAWDPLAHLLVTTTAMGEAARTVDAVAHRWAGGRWLATGGGGYDAYRVVPRAWALTWLAASHEEAPPAIPEAWRQRWSAEADRYGQAPLPAAFGDPPNAGIAPDGRQSTADEAARQTLELVRALVVPRLLDEAAIRGWWSPLGASYAPGRLGGVASTGDPQILPRLARGTLERLAVAPRVIAPPHPDAARDLLLGALSAGPGDGVQVTAAVAGTWIVGLAVSATPTADPRRRELLALGVAPEYRGRGLGTRLLEVHLASVAGDEAAAAGGASPRAPVDATVTLAERDPVEPLDRRVRDEIARRLLTRAGFDLTSGPREVTRADPDAIRATRPAAPR